MTFDVSAVRALYPALADGHAYLDGAAGTQVPVPVIDAITDAYRVGIGNLREREILGKTSRGEILARARQQLKERAAARLGTSRTSREVRGNARAMQRLLEVRAVALADVA